MRKKLTDCIWFVAVCRILSIVLFLLLWELLVNKNVLSPLMFGNLPAPSGVAKELVSIAGEQEFYVHISYSLRRVLTGCAIALVLGVGFGMVIALNKYFDYFFQSIFDLLRPIPQIIWIPISILLFPTVEGSITFITFRPWNIMDECHCCGNDFR